MSDDTMGLDGVVDHVMRVTGRNRRAAKREVWDALVSGKLPALCRHPAGSPERLAVMKSAQEYLLGGEN